MKLQPDCRLAACASLVRPSAVLCDVGTDHGYLPCYLLQQGRISFAVLADVHPRPLEMAQKTVHACGLEQKTELVLSDGLAQVSGDTVTDVVMAGMGGELITRLVTSCDWLYDPQKRLILQPMTFSDVVRQTLSAEGFALRKEIPVRERGHIYTAMLWEYDGERRTVDDVFAQIGCLPDHPSLLTVEKIKQVCDKLRKAANGLRRSQNAENQILAEQKEALAQKLEQAMPKKIEQEDMWDDRTTGL